MGGTIRMSCVTARDAETPGSAGWGGPTVVLVDGSMSWGDAERPRVVSSGGMERSSYELHEIARTWLLNHLGLEEREGEDLLYSHRGQSHKVKARTQTARATSFEFRIPPPDFNFLIGVLADRDGRTARQAFKVNRYTFDQLDHKNEGSGTVRFRISDRGDERLHVEWLV